MTYFLGIDVGSSSIKSVIVDNHGTVRASARMAYDNIIPKPGIVERDPLDMWDKTTMVIREVIANSKISTDDVGCVAATGFGCGIFLLDKQGHPVRNAVVPSDMRCAEQIRHLKQRDDYSELEQLALQSHREGTTLNLIDWFNKHEPWVSEQTRHVMLCKDYINYRLCGSLTSDITDLTGAMIASPADGQINERLFRYMHLENWLEKLPNATMSTDIAGYITKSAAAKTGLKCGTPVAAGCMDVHAVFLTAGVFENTTLGICLGTWGINAIVLDEPKTNKPFPFMQLARGEGNSCLAVEGSPDSTSTLDWFLKCFVGRSGNYSIIFEACQDETIKNSDVLFLPYLKGGKGSPKGGFLGLSFNTTTEMLVCSLMEGVVFQHVREIEKLLSYGTGSVEKSCIVGGASKNEGWLQIFSDCLNLPVETSQVDEQGAFGAAIVAAVAVGEHDSIEVAVSKMSALGVQIKPITERTKIYSEKMNRWENAVGSLKPGWSNW